MGCSSCQQNNHVVPTTHVHNSTAQAHCECACGCSEPVCPTPQPCTEITDSKCIIYTDPAIKCGNDTIVTTNASVSTAMNQIVNYFCSQQGLVTTDDILCGTQVIVPEGTDIQGAFELVVEFICEIQLTPGPAGPAGPAGAIGPAGPPPWTLPATVYNNGFAYPLGAAVLFQGGYYYRTGNPLNPGYPPTPGSISPSWTPVADGGAQGPIGPQGLPGTSGTNGANAYKYVHEDTTIFDGNSITILRQSLEYCNLLPPACSTDPGFADKVCDLHVSVYFLFAGNWKKIPTKPYGILGTEGYELGIDATTGDLTITFSIAPISPAVTVRVVILA